MGIFPYNLKKKKKIDRNNNFGIELYYINVNIIRLYKNTNYKEISILDPNQQYLQN